LRNITVAVTSEQANKLILAQRYGTLSVTLRSSVDEGALAEAEDGRDLVNPNDLLGLAPLPPEPVPEVIETTAEIWRNGAKEKVVFRVPQIREALNATAVAEGQEPTEAFPASVQQPTLASPQKKECEDCGPKPGGTKKATGPTAANAFATGSDLAANTGLSRHPRGAVVEVRVEAEQVGSDKN
jgi:hypothetical protein